MKVVDLIKSFGFELSEDQEKQIKKSVGDDYVPRSEFNTKNAELKTANERLETLEKKDFATLESDRDKYKNDYETLLQEKTNEIKKSKFFEALGDCKDKDYVLYKLGGLEKVELDDKQELKNCDDLVNQAKELVPDYFGKAPRIVSATSGPNEDAASKADLANQALRTLVKGE